MDVREYLHNNILIFDGAMGTMLQERGLKQGDLAELLNLSDPAAVTGVHRAYVEAGSDVVTANTFQAHELKLKEQSVEEIIAAGIGCAKKSGAKFVAMDAGSLGELMQPTGEMSFERAYEIYRRQMVAGEKYGADLVIIETVSDLHEAKAAILAAKENTKLPVFCTMTFGDGGYTFVGCDARTAAVALQSFGADALGVNCSMGPESLKPVVRTMLEYSRIPVILQANAGLPVMRGGKPVYDVTPESYAESVMDMIRDGVSVIGGCCGTTPEYIRAVKSMLGDMKPVPRNPLRVTACTSGRKTVIFADAPVITGIGVDPANNEEVAEAIRENDIDAITDEVLDQLDDGAEILRVNTAVPGIDESAALKETVTALQALTAAPLRISATSAEAAEGAIRAYNGKPIIDLSGMDGEAANKMLALVKKYGTLAVSEDEQAAVKLGISAQDIISASAAPLS